MCTEYTGGFEDYNIYIIYVLKESSVAYKLYLGLQLHVPSSTCGGTFVCIHRHVHTRVGGTPFTFSILRY